MKSKKSKIMKCLWAIMMMMTAFSFPAGAQYTFIESFEGTAFLPLGWSYYGAPTTNYWSRRQSGQGGGPNAPDGNFLARFNSGTAPADTQQTIVTPVMDNSAMTVNDTARITFSMYRNLGNGADSVIADSLTILINTIADTTGATRLGAIARSRIINLPDTFTVTGWHQYTFDFPATFNTSTNYILFRATSQNGNAIYIDNVQWTVFPPPCSGTPIPGSITSADAVLCNGSGTTDLEISGQTSGVPGITLQWQSAAAATGPWVNFGTDTTFVTTDTLTNSTFFRVLVTCTNSGLSDSTAAIEVIVTVDPPVTVSPDNATYCNWTNIPVTLTAAGATDYTWSPATGLDTTAGSVVNSIVTTTIVYTVTGTGIGGCPDSVAYGTVEFHNTPIVSAFANPGLDVCEGDSINLLANSQLGSVTYNWSPLGISGDSVWASPTDTTSYIVTGVSFFGCSSDTSIDTITINVVPPAVASFTNSSTGLVTTFTNTSTNSTYYLWYFGDGDSSFADHPVHAYPYDGIWDITLIAYNGICQDTLRDTVVIITTGLLQHQISNSFMLSPNPSSGNVLIEFSLNESQATLQLLNTLGEVVLTNVIYPSKSHGYRESLSLGDLPSGIYFVQLTSTSQSFVTKLIKE